MVAITKTVTHFTLWHYAHNQYKDTEIWLYRRVSYRIYGWPVWRWTKRKVHIPIWSWANHQFSGVPYRFYTAFGGDEVGYDWSTGETRLV